MVGVLSDIQTGHMLYASHKCYFSLCVNRSEFAASCDALDLWCCSVIENTACDDTDC
jgi:hypothetical protein